MRWSSVQPSSANRRLAVVVRIQNDVKAFACSVVNGLNEACLVRGGEGTSKRWLQSLPAKRYANEIEAEVGVVLDVGRSRVTVVRALRAGHLAELTAGEIDAGKQRPSARRVRSPRRAA